MFFVNLHYNENRQNLFQYYNIDLENNTNKVLEQMHTVIDTRAMLNQQV